MKVDETTSVRPFIKAAKERIDRNTESWSVFNHPMRGDLSIVELLVFATIFETCGLTDLQATRAALAAVSALKTAEVI